MKQSSLPWQAAAFKALTRRVFRHRRTCLRPVALVLGLGLTTALVPATADDWLLGFAEDEAPISDSGPQGVRGIIPELTTELFSRLPGETLRMDAGPWVRMQRWVASGEIDGFVTYPSEERREYALFSQTPVYNIDIGYLVYRHDHLQRDRLESARSFDDLSGLVFIGQQGAEWERDNIPACLETILVGQLDTMMHLLVRRQTGDFLVMPPEQAVAIARRLGYNGQLAFHPVDFIPNARIPFHLGLRRSHPDARALIERADSVLRSPGYQEAADRIVSVYR
ncbi:MAG TPA: ABC transporter substrate-binding protein [Saccharospirillum sp.]|nr:ABC transporter substrate-binding protein [Saccharospirillum sp.]